MTVDRYTKAVLTLIAMCLLWLSVGGPSLITTVVTAQTDRVYLAGWIDQDGAVRAFPRQSSSVPFTPGSNATPTPLPVWQFNK
jgi:hypothetical protein